MKSKKILYLFGLIIFSGTTSFAMEKFKEALWNPTTQICGASALMFLGGKTVHNLVTAQISPRFYGGSKYITPLTNIFRCIKHNPIYSCLPLAAITLAARAGNVGPTLEAGQLIKPLAYALGGIF